MPDTGVDLGSQVVTSRHPHFALLAVVETPATPPTTGAQHQNPLYDLYVGPSIGMPIVLPYLLHKTSIYTCLENRPHRGIIFIKNIE